jgi:hypothetical protein
MTDTEPSTTGWVARLIQKLTTNTNSALHQKILLALTCLVNFNFLLSFVKVPLTQSHLNEMLYHYLVKKLVKHLYKELVRGRVKQIYLALDQDAINDSLKYAKELMSYGKEIFLLELEGKDPGDLGFEEMTRILHRTQNH